MEIKRQLQKITFFSLTFAMAGSIPMQISAQDPARSPQSPPASQPKPSTQEKSDQSPTAAGKPAGKSGNAQGAPSEEPAQDMGNETIKIDTELVQFDVTVIDQNNNPIYGLHKEDFTVYEDKVKQQVEYVSSEEIPISFGLVIDTSGSMRSKIKTISDASLDLIKQKRDDDEGFVVQFKTDYEVVQEFTQDENDLEYAIGQLFTSGGTSLLDAIISSSNYAHQKGKRRRKAIIVISDGLEQNSLVKEQQVIEAIKENEVQLYMIGFLEKEEGNPFIKSPAQKAKELLTHLAEDSGGRAFFPTSLKEIPMIAAQIAKDLRTQYIVSYYPSNEKRDGAYRKLRVDIAPKGNQRFVARARQGYYAQATEKVAESKE